MTGSYGRHPPREVSLYIHSSLAWKDSHRISFSCKSSLLPIFSKLSPLRSSWNNHPGRMKKLLKTCFKTTSKYVKTTSWTASMIFKIFSFCKRYRRKKIKNPNFSRNFPPFSFLGNTNRFGYNSQLGLEPPWWRFLEGAFRYSCPNRSVGSADCELRKSVNGVIP